MAGLRATRSGPKNYFKEIKFVFKLVGVSLEGNESMAYRIYSFVIFFFFNIMYLSLYFMEAFKQDIKYVADAIFVYMVAFGLATVKVVVVLRNRLQFGKLLAKLEEEPFTANLNRGGELEEKLIRKCIWITTVQTFTYWIMGYGNIMGACLFAFSSRLKSGDYHDWDLTYGPLTVLNLTYSPNYEIFFMYQSVSAYIYAAQFSCVDLLTAAVMAHVSYQFKMLQNNMRRLVQISYKKMLKETRSPNLLQGTNLSIGNDDEINDSSVPWKYLKQSLQEAVDYHMAVINIAGEIETVFSELLLIVFLTTLVLLCVLIFQASMLSFDNPKFAPRIGETIFIILQVVTVCYWGEQVMGESQEVGRAAYDTNFVGTDLRFQKSLVLIIRRSQNPTIVTAGKFTTVYLPTFAWILRTSYSAFMMLLNMQQTKYD